MKPRFALLSLIAIALVFGVGTSALAQPPPGKSGKTGDPRQDAKLKRGPFYLSPTLSLDRFGIDTNVFNAGGEQESDFTFTLTPGLSVWFLAGRRLKLGADVASGLTYFRTYADQRSVNPSFSVNGEVDVRRISLSGSASVSTSRTRPNDEIDTRVRHSSNGQSLGVAGQLGTRTNIGFSGYRDEYDYGFDAIFAGRSLKASLDRTEKGLRFKVSRKLTSLTTLGITGESKQDRFKFSGSRDANGFRTLLTADFAEKALLAGHAELGVRLLDPFDPKVPNFDGFIAKVALAYKLRGTMEFRVVFDRDVQYSFDLANPYYLDTGRTFRLRRQLAGKFDAIAQYDRRTHKYTAPLVVTTEAPRNLLRTGLVDVGYRLNRDTRVGFTVSRISRATRPASGRQFAAWRAGMSFNYGY